MFDAVVITCEHGGNRVPAKYKKLFAGYEELLASHRGYDPGALKLARQFAKAGDWPLYFSTVTRLLVELNRSLHHRALFSAFTAPLDPPVKYEILERFYAPHRDAVEGLIRESVNSGQRVLHLSVHSFTPVLNGETRRADIGLLYNPKSRLEKSFCDAWQQQLAAARQDLIVRRNYPYLGTADGFTTYLRTKFPAKHYAGIELEVNQRYPNTGGGEWKELRAVLVATFARATNATR